MSHNTTFKKYQVVIQTINIKHLQARWSQYSATAQDSVYLLDSWFDVSVLENRDK